MSNIDEDIQKYRQAYNILVKKMRVKKGKTPHSRNKLTKSSKKSGQVQLLEPSSEPDEHIDIETCSLDNEPYNSDSSVEVIKNPEHETANCGPVLSTFPCKACGTNYRTEENLQLHIQTHQFRKKYEKKWSCGDCLYNFKSENMLLRHNCKSKIKKSIGSVKQIHPKLMKPTDLHSCGECFAIFKNQPDLEEHRKANHFSNYVCNLCSKTFMLKVAYEKHLLVHKKSEEYHCKLCSKVCKTKEGLKAHNVVHQRDILNLAVSALTMNEDLGDMIEKNSSVKQKATAEPQIVQSEVPPQLSEPSPPSLITPTDVPPELSPKGSPTLTSQPTKINRQRKQTNQTNFPTFLAGIQPPIPPSEYVPPTHLKSQNHRADSLINLYSYKMQPIVRVVKMDERVIELHNKSVMKNIQSSPFGCDGNKPKCQLCFLTFENKELLFDHLEMHLGRNRNVPKKKNVACENANLNIGSQLSFPEISPSTSISNNISLNKTTPNEEAPPYRFLRNAPANREFFYSSVLLEGDTIKKGGKRKSKARGPKTSKNGRKTMSTKSKRPMSRKRKSNPKAVRKSAKNNSNINISEEQEMCSSFDPNYIIKIEPDDSPNESFNIEKYKVSQKPDLDSIFVVNSDGHQEKRFKASEYIKDLKVLSVRLTDLYQ